MRWLITRASGQLGAYLLRELSGQDVVAWQGTRDVDLTRRDVVAAAFRGIKPTIVLHAAALATVSACQRDPQRAWAVNAEATALLAELAAECSARLVYVSTDLVFDGERGSYCEDDEARPLSIYGQTKLAAEPRALAAGGVVARLSLLFGPTLSERPAFFDAQVRALREERPITCFDDEWRTPLSLVTAARALTDLVRSDCRGLFHLGGPARLSRWEMGRILAAHLRADPGLVLAAPRNGNPALEPRPRDTSLDSSRWRRLFWTAPWPTFTNALHELLPQNA